MSIVETLKEYHNILLGHQIRVYTDHKNLVYKHFNTNQVIRWQLLLEEYGPELIYIKGQNIIVADALSCLDMTDHDFSHEVLAFGGKEFPASYPLSFSQIEHEQLKDPALQQEKLNQPTVYKTEQYTFSDKKYELITKEGKIVLPPSLQQKAVEWYHEHLLHPGETRMELTIGQHYTFHGLRDVIKQVCKTCPTCQRNKVRHRKYGQIPPEQPEYKPWHTLCIDLIGPYQIGQGKNEITLHCLTMIDPATGWFEIAEIPTKKQMM